VTGRRSGDSALPSPSGSIAARIASIPVDKAVQGKFAVDSPLEQRRFELSVPPWTPVFRRAPHGSRAPPRFVGLPLLGYGGRKLLHDFIDVSASGSHHEFATLDRRGQPRLEASRTSRPPARQKIRRGFRSRLTGPAAFRSHIVKIKRLWPSCVGSCVGKRTCNLSTFATTVQRHGSGRGCIGRSETSPKQL
jgi:hypothetical protein